MAPVTEHTEPLGEQPAFWRSAPGGDPPVLYLHGVPNTGGQWTALLERTGGVAPDLPGFGRSGKRGDGDFTMTGLGRWLDGFLDLAGLDRVRLVVHDWGAVGLLWAMRNPERVERLVIVDAVPFLPGYRWHAVARAWRTPLLGEVAMGLNTRGPVAPADAASRGRRRLAALRPGHPARDPAALPRRPRRTRSRAPASSSAR